MLSFVCIYIPVCNYIILHAVVVVDYMWNYMRKLLHALMDDKTIPEEKNEKLYEHSYHY
jgi:hypothetical protein